MVEKLRLKFDPNQEYQLTAIQSVVRLLEGLSQHQREFVLGDEIVPNLSPDEFFLESWLLENLQTIQEQNGLPQQLALEVDDGLVLEGTGDESWRSHSFTIEMETGTGKTYAYLRTLYELRKHYGFSKFIIVVPSVAIYEGVIKSFQITRSHLRSLYGNEIFNLIAYDGAQISRVRSFATSSFAEVMVMTDAALNKLSNNLYKPSEKLPGERRPYQWIQETRPILILDEPQSIDTTEKAKSAIRTLHPLFTLRYSATHRESPNLLYRLTPVAAYRQNLVKKIQVIGLSELENLNQLILNLESVTRSPITAIVKTLVQEQGVAKEVSIILKQGDNLHNKTHRNEHIGGYIVEEINAARGSEFIRFQNGVQISLKDSAGPSRPEVFRAQIEQTITQHMKAQTSLYSRGIKVLSLFFIDRVANYTAENGFICAAFDQAFNRIKARYPHFQDFSPEQVREGYFAKAKSKVGEAIDTSGRNQAEREAEKAAFALIMKDKERLLSFAEPVSFIFAHSALKEGWDNPNVFQICTLNQTTSEFKKRQEIGRGLRLCVDQTGERIFDEDVNVLTVIANESYETYAATLQREYIEANEEAPPKPKRPKTNETKRNDAIFDSPEFHAFWLKLCRCTRYNVDINTEVLIEECITKLNSNKTIFPEPKVVLTRGRFVITEFTIRLDSATKSEARILIEIRDTDGNVRNGSYKVKPRDDLAKIWKDERLRGYKVLEIIEDGDNSRVRFVNEIEVSKYRPRSFESEKGQKPDERAVMTLSNTYPVFNLIDRTAKETHLTRPTINQIFQGMQDKKKALLFKNPEGFAGAFITTIKDAVADHIVNGLEFLLEPATLPYDVADIFPPLKAFPQKELIEAGQRGLYDKVQVDSTVEENFVNYRLLPDERKLILYFKLPPAFKVPLPKLIGNYNPDWGIVRQDENGSHVLQLVRETKGANARGSVNLDELRFPQERRKILCAKKYFQLLGVDYDIVSDQDLDWCTTSREEAFQASIL